VPYKDPEKQRSYQREYQRRRRNGCKTPPGSADLPAPFRLRAAEDLLKLLEEQVDAVRLDPATGTIEKARCIGGLTTVALRALEQRDLSVRVEALERALKRRERPHRAAA
jgi:hypothetical protein